MSFKADKSKSFVSDGLASAHERVLPSLSPPLPAESSPHSIDSASSGERVDRTPSPLPPNASSRQHSQPPHRARDRGYSLWRSLFAKNVSTLEQERKDAVELTAQQSAFVILPSEPASDNAVALARSLSTGDIVAQKAPSTHTTRPSKGQLGRYFYNKARKVILRIRDVPHSADGRHIHINGPNPLDERTHEPYIHNSIRSSRYNLLSFFPRQLFAQFSKLANAYFLVISIMQLIPGLSTTGQFTTIVPLLAFVGISMAKEGWDDVRRWKLDKEENKRITMVLRKNDTGKNSSLASETIRSSESKSWIAQKWSDIKVGDIVRLNRDDQVPADMILLYAAGGAAYIETMALDGETNLKNKQAPEPLSKQCELLDAVSLCQGEIVVEDPSMDLYRFEGKICVGHDYFPLTTKEIIYRGSVLRNTSIAAGIVCYTGEECRIRQNANKNPRIKAPALQSLVNKIVILIAAFVMVLSLGCAFGYRAWDSFEDRAWYLQSASVNWGHVLASFIIMFNTLLPLSLYVSMEIVKLIQIHLMNGDLDMFDEASNTPMQCQTSTINEELGQVSYIFSDKTGTLTKNEMKVKKLSCAGYIWNHDAVLHPIAPKPHSMATEGRARDKATFVRKSEATAQVPKNSILSSTAGARNSIHGPVSSEASSIGLNGPNGPVRESTTVSAQQSTRQLLECIYQSPLSPLARKARLFILSLALCHTCVPEKRAWSDEIHFQATSPDELALVTAAQQLGYLVVSRQGSTITVKTCQIGTERSQSIETYEVLHIIEFTSSRRCMSVVIKEPDGRICVHCKGADTRVRTLLRRSDLAAVQVQEIEERVRERKSLEAQAAIRRRSTAATSGQTSLGPAVSGRKSGFVQAKSSKHFSLGQWLSDRETDAAISLSSPIRANRPSLLSLTSAHVVSPRQSMLGVDTQEHAVAGTSVSPQSPPNQGVNEDPVSNEPWVMGNTFAHVNEFANEGLRTLLHACRYLSEEEYHDWAKVYREASTSLTDREARISQAADLIERQFDLVGATAIEDKLQDGVPDAIDRLRRANIKLWMLTGDKRETAISISRSCRIAKDYSTFVVLDDAAGDVMRQMNKALQNISQGAIAHAVLVVDGETLTAIEGNKEQKSTFLNLAVLVESVVCCRCSPSQKALLVRSVRHHVDGAVTLAIGDGANDVAMIQEADIGIGISGGKEGLQAARTSDYAIAQFRFLCKLLLVHGRNNYDRISKYILATTYKEMLFYTTQALYQRSNGYTGTSLYESWSLSWYNALFTSLPVIFLGAFMAEVLPITLLAVPELYTRGQRNGSFNFKTWLWWTFMASAEAMLVFFIMDAIYGQIPFTLDNGLFAMGVMTYTATVIIVSVKLQILEVHNKNVLALIAIVVSVGGWFGWNLLLSAVYKNNVVYNVKAGFSERFGRNALWWLTLTLIIISFLLFELAIKALKTVFLPSDVTSFQIFEQDPVLRQRFADSAAPFLQHSRTPSSLKTRHDGEAKAAIQAEREAHVEAILRKRTCPEHDVSNEPTGPADGVKAENTIRKSIDVFSKGFGLVRKEHLQ